LAVLAAFQQLHSSEDKSYVLRTDRTSCVLIDEGRDIFGRKIALLVVVELVDVEALLLQSPRTGTS
jgi:hypothetical protein